MNRSLGALLIVGLACGAMACAEESATSNPVRPGGARGTDGLVDETPVDDDDANGGMGLPVGTTLRTTARLNFREGPSTDSPVIRTLDIGTLVTIVESEMDSGFYRVRVGSQQGWVHGNYVQSSSAVPDEEVPEEPEPELTGQVETCRASYYASGSRTANGERFNPNGLTAAHKTLAFNTRVRVTNTATGASVDVRINDRGPFVGGRCIDLARGAFVAIATTSQGVANVRVEVLR